MNTIPNPEEFTHSQIFFYAMAVLIIVMFAVIAYLLKRWINSVDAKLQKQDELREQERIADRQFVASMNDKFQKGIDSLNVTFADFNKTVNNVVSDLKVFQQKVIDGMSAHERLIEDHDERLGRIGSDMHNVKTDIAVIKQAHKSQHGEQL